MRAEAREALDHLRRQHRARIARASVCEIAVALGESVQQLRNFAAHAGTSAEASLWNHAADQLADVARDLRGSP